MVKLSRYAHTFELDGAVAMYHSLRMKPVYLNRESYENLRECLASSFFNTLDDAPETLKNEINELVKYKILTKTDDEDDKTRYHLSAFYTKKEMEKGIDLFNRWRQFVKSK